MKIGTILILTLMISTATCQDETDRKQERVVINNAVGLSIGVIFGIVVGIVFAVCATKFVALYQFVVRPAAWLVAKNLAQISMFNLR
jgi:hypothetical protein